MIIVDDCSTDDTVNIVHGYSLNDSRIRFFSNDTNSGAAVSRNRALREAKGEWIAFLDGDDIWLPTKLEKQLEFMQKNNYAFSYHEYEEIDEKSIASGLKVSGPRHITKRGMYNYCWPGCLTVMYNRSVIGLIQIPDIKKNNDYSIWLRAIKKADCYLCSQTLACYRRRVGSISNIGYAHLVKWHFRMFRIVEKQNIVIATLNTIRNIFFGCIKKVLYVQSIK